MSSSSVTIDRIQQTCRSSLRSHVKGRRIAAFSPYRPGTQRSRTGADRAFPAQHRCPDRRRARASRSTPGDLATEWPWHVKPPKRSPSFASRSRRARAPCRWRGMPGPATGAAATSAGSSASSRQGRPRRPAADGRRLRSDDAVQPALRVLLRRRPAEHRRRVAPGADARARCARRSPISRASRSA